jgi:hypothetical protein
MPQRASVFCNFYIRVDREALVSERALDVGSVAFKAMSTKINIQASHAWLKKSNIHPETEGFIFAIQDRVINTRNYKKHICGL